MLEHVPDSPCRRILLLACLVLLPAASKNIRFLVFSEASFRNLFSARALLSRRGLWKAWWSSYSLPRVCHVSVRVALSVPDERGLDEMLHKAQLMHLDWLGLICAGRLGSLRSTLAVVYQT